LSRVGASVVLEVEAIAIPDVDPALELIDDLAELE
jgi:hypothetical protein